jgi:CO/xanthine dehydrogenase FAD-binding subunit
MGGQTLAGFPMKPRYVLAGSLGEALAHLDQYGERTRVLGGGTDLMIALRSACREGKALPDYLLDVSEIPDCQTIREEDGRLILGSAVTFRTLENHPIIKQSLPLLAAAAALMGSVQVRRLATIGGNVGTASPAGDGITPLVACAAEAQLISKNGNRTLPVSELISGPGRTRLAIGELVHSFILEIPEQPHRFFFHKIMRRQAVAIARMNLAVQAALGPTGRIASARLSAGAVFPTPRRLMEVEGLLVGQVPKKDLFEEAGRTAARAMLQVSGRRSSMAYKEPALERLVAWGLEKACGFNTETGNFSSSPKAFIGDPNVS